MVKLAELKRRLAEEMKRSAELPAHEEELEDVIIDLGFTGGGLTVLFGLRGAYVTNSVDGRIQEIIEKGKAVRIKARKIKYTRRLSAIDAVEELDVDDLDVHESRVVSGKVEVGGTYVRIITDEGERVYLAEGTVNYSKLLERGGGYGIIIFSVLEDRGNYKRARGILFIPADQHGASAGGEEEVYL